MNPNCDRCGRPGARNSFYVRNCDRVKITQYRCLSCKRTWTEGTNTLEKRQRLRSINEKLGPILVSCVSMRRAAKLLGINRKTVARRIPYLAAKARLAQSAPPAESPSCPEIFLDELITFEHTRCKPLAVCMAVSKERKILAFSVSSMPPIGKHLRRISLKKYGKRPNHRRKGLASCLEAVAPYVGPTTRFISDEEPSYRQLLLRHYPGLEHQQHPSKRAVIAGQGELKDHSYDPLFAINHTFAMLRANLARLVRRTWVTTKKTSRLEEFIQIYAGFHNLELIARAS
jgi:hypothetical protein